MSSLDFGSENGSAKKSKIDYIKLNMGENRVRFVGGILPKYVYWKQLNGHTIPVECLGFDRDKERFTNIEKDWFNNYFPIKANGDKLTCSWAYAIQAIDLADGKLKVFGLKKKLYEQIKDLARELGSPTDIDKGWDVVFTKTSTGSQNWNVEYKLKDRSIEARPLTEEERETIKDMKDISEIIVRPTADEQHAFIKEAWLNEESNADSDATSEFKDDDIPF